MSLSGVDNMSQTLTGIEDSDINVNSVTTSYLNSIPAKTISYLDATSSIQTQFNTLNGTLNGGNIVANTLTTNTLRVNSTSSNNGISNTGSISSTRLITSK